MEELRSQVFYGTQQFGNSKTTENIAGNKNDDMVADY